MHSATLLLIDDHPLFRRGLAELLSESGEFTVVGQASSGREGISLACQLSPELILLDLHMPGLGGLQVLDELRQLELDSQVIVLTASADRAELAAALRLGAEGYLLKDTEPEALLDYVRGCGRGSVQLDGSLVALLAEPGPAAPPDELTAREGQTLALIAQGLSNKRIARELGISDGTVKIYVKNLLRKFHLGSRLELAAWVHRGGGPH
ncbi:two-component system, NarL family, nitrate/nitrite response regulator NarL [Pseudomonas citronellolis]|jgi:two-component system nitrate/nitrite response regulator NarL|uniref:Two-component system, NarL family, nitrate/nitrite response regulator NarL n=1 Tax=Pseudomonas citronellolis TaxID=53408 RepID=A0AAQ1KEJ2_9PSED|nr:MULTISPECIES: response regulator [Pseudomonas]AMO76845.1 Nitrate/nitrite response regulator protein NarL [Pseudomonas citronellolis]KES22320.1 transcriptional regulator [Pseudomonas sp. AAC]MBB1609781.1 DNA-binding response regulator [Pseudomonas sp. UMC76]MBB1638749.1 DNA-binding response regulator [Pseudomonas sp. UME83]MCL6687479.1 response regulator [Pseudomonas sp. R3.Fl]